MRTDSHQDWHYTYLQLRDGLHEQAAWFGAGHVTRSGRRTWMFAHPWTIGCTHRVTLDGYTILEATTLAEDFLELEVPDAQ